KTSSCLVFNLRGPRLAMATSRSAIDSMPVRFMCGGSRKSPIWSARKNFWQQETTTGMAEYFLRRHVHLPMLCVNIFLKRHLIWNKLPQHLDPTDLNQH